MSPENVERCPICDGHSFAQLHTIMDYTSSHEMFHVKRCDQCSLVFTSPRPSEALAQHYYQSEDYISHTSSSQTLFDRIYLIIRHFTLRWKHTIIQPYLKGGTLLDYGCGTGHFLQKVKGSGHKVYGVEPSTNARSKITSEITVADNLRSLPTETFQVITLWHVLEHVYQLRETLRELKSRLANDGTIFIAVPNMESYDAKYYCEYWAAYDVPRHLWHFTKPTMTALLEKEGLKVKRIIPMKLDSIYVSLLSEKYKRIGSHSILGVLRAVWVGLQSNFYGSKNCNYSSLIFVVQQ